MIKNITGLKWEKLREKRAAKQRIHVRNLREKRKQIGLCARCGKDKPGREHLATCRACHDYGVARNREYKNRKKEK